MIATSGTMLGKCSHVSPPNSTRLTMGRPAARSFIAQPSRIGSTKVSSPTFVSTPGRRAATSRCMS
jgi:hypothetical protein